MLLPETRQLIHNASQMPGSVTYLTADALKNSSTCGWETVFGGSNQKHLFIYLAFGSRKRCGDICPSCKKAAKTPSAQTEIQAACCILCSNVYTLSLLYVFDLAPFYFSGYEALCNRCL